MNLKNLSHKLGGFTLALLILSGITFFSATTASAQQRQVHRPVVIVRPVIRPFGWYRSYRPFGWYDRGWYNNYWYNPYSQYVFDNSEKAAQTAYKNGYETGEKDGRKNKSFSYERSHYFKEAGFGNFAEVYRRNFARGYENGYQVGAANATSKR